MSTEIYNQKNPNQRPEKDDMPDSNLRFAPTSGLAIASLVLGILSLLSALLLPIYFIITGVLAVLFGHVSLRRIVGSKGSIAGNGLAIAGLVIGYIATTVAVGLYFWLQYQSNQLEKVMHGLQL